ncbi:catalase family protein [Massilia niastensis]|uniref:catalase family protein n=1 Tax=Massilia niastensis TaxID=544911 RepID=UPI00036958CE|nr:catalase family protein [Massilia niastensis]
MSQTSASITPIPYQPGHEQIGIDEAEAIYSLQNVFAGMANQVAAAEGHAHRAVHAKGHALLRGALTIADGLPEAYAQGLFATPGAYDVLLRWSSPPAEQLPDSVSTPRAVALKILKVPGERLDPGKGGQSQDFLMVNGPAFARPGPQGFLADVKLLAATTNRSPAGKTVISTVMRTAEAALEALGGESGKLKGMGGEPQRHPLGETYFTQTPFLYGRYMAKLSLAAVSPALHALDGAGLPNDDDAQRAAIGAHFAGQGGEWELRVQLCVDTEKMPIEDASVEWPQDLSPFVAVARLSVPAQAGWDPATSPRLEDETAFDPWNCLDAHRPLGAVNRARKEVMAVSRQLRSEFNRCPIREPG